MEKKSKFEVDCPFCNSTVNVKTGRKLKFETLRFIPIPYTDENERYVYKDIPTYKCKYCKNRFIVDMRTHRVCKPIDIQKAGFYGDGIHITLNEADDVL